MKMTQTSAASFSFVTFLTGFILGTGAGLLLAPQPGVRTRRHLRHLSHNLCDKADDLVEEAKELVGYVFHDTGRVGQATAPR